MNNKTFKELLAQIGQLSLAQRGKLTEALAPKAVKENTASLINRQSEDGIVCAHCGGTHIKRWGFDGKIQRYRCHACRRTFNALSGTPMAKLQHKELWLEYEKAMAEGLSIRKAAAKLKIDPSTAFRWRHRFLAAPSEQTDTELTGIVEADETYFPESNKGQRNLNRKARKRGGTSKRTGVVYKKIAVLVVRDRQGKHFDAIVARTDKKSYAALLPQLLSEECVLCTDGSGALREAARMNEITHVGLNTKDRERVKQRVFHIQHVNAYHAHLKQWMIRFHGVATKYLTNYLAWHRFQYLSPVEPTPAQRLRRSMGFGNV
jgi:transposase-like protein